MDLEKSLVNQKLTASFQTNMCFKQQCKSTNTDESELLKNCWANKFSKTAAVGARAINVGLI